MLGVAVISAVEQMIPVWLITSLGNVRPSDQILGIFICSEKQKIFNYKKPLILALSFPSLHVFEFLNLVET